jgi:hypothetical protein
MTELSDRNAFKDVDWTKIPESPGVYVIYDGDQVIYVGMTCLAIFGPVEA